MAITKKAIAVQEEKRALFSEYRSICDELRTICTASRVPDAVIRGDAVLAATWKDRLVEACQMRPAFSERQTAEEIKSRIIGVRGEVA